MRLVKLESPWLWIICPSRGKKSFPKFSDLPHCFPLSWIHRRRVSNKSSWINIAPIYITYKSQKNFQSQFPTSLSRLFLSKITLEDEGLNVWKFMENRAVSERNIFIQILYKKEYLESLDIYFLGIMKGTRDSKRACFSNKINKIIRGMNYKGKSI